MALLKIEPEWVTLPSDKAKAEKDPAYVAPGYLIGALSFGERAQVMDLLGANEPPYGSVRALQVRGGLRGWRNLGVEFKPDSKGKPTDEQLGMLDALSLKEIGEEAWKRSTLSEANRGN